MKSLKKLSVIGVAAVMGCSVFAFTACNPDNGNDDNDDNGNNAVVGVAGEHAALINGALGQEIKAFGADFNVTVNTAYDYYNYVNGKKADKIEGRSSTTVFDAAVNLKANLETGDLDVSHVIEDTYSEKTETSYMYVFLRAGKLFVSDYLENAITDYSKAEFLYAGALKDFMELPEGGEDMDEITGALDEILGNVNVEEEIGAAVEGVLGLESYTAMALADSFGALTVESGKATVDLNKAVYNAVKAVKEFLGGISINTTVGEILNNKTLKGVLSPFINLIAPADLVKAIKDNLVAPDGSDIQTEQVYEMLKEIADKILLKPNANETTYDYLVRVISSEELKNVVNDLIKESTGSTQLSIDKTFDKLTVGFMLGMGGITETQFKEKLNSIKAFVDTLLQNVTEKSVTIKSSGVADNDGPSVGEGEVSPAAEEEELTFIIENTFENVKIVYSLNGNEITGQQVTAKVTNSQGMLFDEEWLESVAVVDVDATVEYEATVSLADINAAKTIEIEKVYESISQNIGIYADDTYVSLNVTNLVDNKGGLLGITVEYDGKALEFEDYGDLKECYIEDFENGSFYLGYSQSEDYFEFYINGLSAGVAHFDSEDVYYTNTVAGILAGKQSTLLG